MAEKRSVTPEKQLLELIENSETQELSTEGISRKGRGLFSLGALRARLSFIKENLNLKSFFRKSVLNVKGINKVLILCVLMLSLYLGISFNVSRQWLKNIPDFPIAAGAAGGVSEAGLILKDLDHYLNKTKTKNIFKFGRIAEPEPEPVSQSEDGPAVPDLSSKLEELIADLRLVGIGWSSKNPDVMIEDTEKGKILFLKKGSPVKDGIIVKEIFKNRVILELDGEEADLESK
ncbi:MAG: hypothetical protein KAV18_00330 [Candidatus Omnitrophica bacterium]|nr:hypothetical protein [Candidatus Omnitrophota bacterium]